VADVPAGPTIVAQAIATEFLSTLKDVLVKLELVDILNSCEGPKFTVFAPTNEAFENAFDIANIDSVDRGALLNFVLNHVVPGVSGEPVYAADIKDGMVVETAVAGCTFLVFNVTDTDVFVNDAKVTTADIQACNGVVHVIDRVLYTAEVVEH
jgi:uncharacterized surface protein with fasciclin (FAS1) repeats